jgi:hypothetical protein
MMHIDDDAQLLPADDDAQLLPADDDAQLLTADDDAQLLTDDDDAQLLTADDDAQLLTRPRNMFDMAWSFASATLRPAVRFRNNLPLLPSHSANPTRSRHSARSGHLSAMCLVMISYTMLNCVMDNNI